MRRSLVSCLVVAGLSAAVQAQDQPAAQEAGITLTTGETLRGVVLERGPETVKIRHPVLGELSVPVASIESLGGQPYQPVEAPAEPEEPAAPDDEVAPTEWTSSLELGVSGSEGNTENSSGRFVLRTERVIEDVERFEFLSRYRLETDNGDRTENELYTQAIQEWFLPDSPRWSWFLQGDAEYDEFQDWDLRVSGTVGLGYIFIDEEETKLRGRIGLGAAYEFGATDERLIPEGLIGYDFEHQINERSRFTSSGDLFPDLEETGEFRSYLDAAYEVDMTDAGDWRLRVGVDHQYDSDSDVRPWDFSYYVSVVLSF